MPNHREYHAHRDNTAGAGSGVQAVLQTVGIANFNAEVTMHGMRPLSDVPIVQGSKGFPKPPTHTVCAPVVVAAVRAQRAPAAVVAEQGAGRAGVGSTADVAPVLPTAADNGAYGTENRDVEVEIGMHRQGCAHGCHCVQIRALC